MFLPLFIIFPRLPDGDLFAPVDTYPYEGREYATQLLV